jgi:hypothetical protein
MGSGGTIRSEAVKLAKVMALMFGVKMAIQVAIVLGSMSGVPAFGSWRNRRHLDGGHRSAHAAGSIGARAGGGYGEYIGFPGGFDPAGEISIGIGVYLVANHTDLLGRDGNFWSDVAYILASWWAIKKFPTWSKGSKIWVP